MLYCHSILIIASPTDKQLRFIAGSWSESRDLSDFLIANGSLNAIWFFSGFGSGHNIICDLSWLEYHNNNKTYQITRFYN